MPTSSRKQLALIALITLAVFSPSIFADLCYIDDKEVYLWIEQSNFSLLDLFLPRSQGGLYYRPLIGASYLFDKHVWMLDTRLMHLDNIVFHLFNTLLVYYLATLLIPVDSRKKSFVPIISAFVFGLHPIVVESVAWISGRTDIMACTFVLLSFASLLKYCEKRKLRYLTLAAFLLIPGILFKETPIVFILGAVFILRGSYTGKTIEFQSIGTETRKLIVCAGFALSAALLMLVFYSGWVVVAIMFGYVLQELFMDRRAGIKIRISSVVTVSSAMVFSIGIFFLARKVVFTSSINSVSRTIKLIVEDLNYALQTFLGTAGFYVKKFFVPLPLNFAIREVDPLYNMVGVFVLFFCIYLIRHRTMLSAIFLTGVCMFLPSLPLSLGTVTWTAYAERYMYMSTAFWTLATVLWLHRKAEGTGYRKLAFAGAIVLILLAGSISLKRSFIWKSNLAILADTVEQNPGFKILRLDYMIALINNGDLEKAKVEYWCASSILSAGYLEQLDLNMAVIYTLEGNYDAADRMYETAIRKSRGKSAIVYGEYVEYLQRRYFQALKEKDISADRLGESLLMNMQKLQKLNHDPMLLYNMGKLCLLHGKCEASSEYFAEAAKRFPPGHDYRIFSSRLASNLQRGVCLREKP